METKLKIAIQKSGRLFDDSSRLLREVGMEFNNGLTRLKNEALNFPLEVLLLRDDDIPRYVEDKVADVGIVGENVLQEKNPGVSITERLGFGRCRLSIAIPRNEKYTGLQDLEGKRIATSYPGLVTRYLEKNGIRAEIHEISGSVEIAPGIGLADAICDLVSTGSTLLSNGLREAEVILRSEAVLISNPALPAEKQLLLDKLLFRMRAVRAAKSNKYIMLNAPNPSLEAICRILPGMKSPTIVPLSDKNWSSVHSVVNENEFWDVIEQLRGNGAQGILVVPIEKMIL